MSKHLNLSKQGTLHSICICNSDTLGTTLNDDELEEAIRLLDTNRNNVIDFNEFVDFWVNKVSASGRDASKSKCEMLLHEW